MLQESIVKNGLLRTIVAFMTQKEQVTELQINCKNFVFYKEAGQRKNVSVDLSEEHVQEFIDYANTDNSENPRFMLETTATLQTGATMRIHILLPPVCKHPQITIAKKTNSLNSLSALEEKGMFNSEIRKFLVKVVTGRGTIILSGPSGAGKTTMLECLTRELPSGIRIGVVEDVPELQLAQKNVIYSHSTLAKPGQTVTDIASLSWCVKQLNRQRVDRIIIGETRGEEFSDFITAANSGCEGSLTTIHGNTPEMALQKMTNFVNLATRQDAREINQNIASTVDVIVQILPINGKPTITEIVSLTKTLSNDSSARIATQDIYIYDIDNKRWAYKGFVDERMKAIFEESERTGRK